VQEALRFLHLEDVRPLRIVDIGDSCGMHLQYLKYLYKDIDTLSVNLDPEAIKRIKQKGMDAICARVEDMDLYSKGTDVCLSFEMLEHLSDPVNFLYRFSRKVKPKAFIITVPYVDTSRVGLRYIKNREPKDISAESVHIFELSPAD